MQNNNTDPHPVDALLDAYGRPPVVAVSKYVTMAIDERKAQLARRKARRRASKAATGVEPYVAWDFEGESYAKLMEDVGADIEKVLGVPDGSLVLPEARKMSQALAKEASAYEGLQPSGGPNRKHRRRYAQEQKAMLAGLSRHRYERRRTEGWRKVLETWGTRVDAFDQALKDKSIRELKKAGATLNIKSYGNMNKAVLREAIVKAKYPHPSDV